VCNRSRLEVCRRFQATGTWLPQHSAIPRRTLISATRGAGTGDVIRFAELGQTRRLAAGIEALVCWAGRYWCFDLPLTSRACMSNFETPGPSTTGQGKRGKTGTGCNVLNIWVLVTRSLLDRTRGGHRLTGFCKRPGVLELACSVAGPKDPHAC
jgi:hypothetical protein